MFAPRKLAQMGLFVALTALFSMLSIYVTESFRLVSFVYLPGALGSMLYGPWAGLVMGFAGDFVAYVVKPMGPYFFGYALSAMLQNFIYAVFLYRRGPSMWRVAAAQALVAVFVSLGLGFLWLRLLYGATAAEFFAGARIVRTLIQYPVDVALLYGVCRLLARTGLAERARTGTGL
ncbi:MAG: folate family ECF transporter S component [Oscillospiraceae bacterium]|nr:folate family ECF transporter S component [Oscillospiraceae bacterium]